MASAVEGSVFIQEAEIPDRGSLFPITALRRTEPPSLPW